MGTVSVPPINAGTAKRSEVVAAIAAVANEFNGNIDNANVKSGAAIDSSKIVFTTAGLVVQEAHVTTSSVATGTTVIPYDDTIPQNTEGDQYLTLSITPKATTNLLNIQVLVYLSNSVANDITVALFQDTTANALAAGAMYQASSGGLVCLKLDYQMAAGTTSATTFKVRGGGNLAGTTTFNGLSGNRRFGGVMSSSITIYEIKA